MSTERPESFQLAPDPEAAQPAQASLAMPGLAEAAAEAYDAAAGLAVRNILQTAQPRVFDHVELCARPLFKGTDADPQPSLFGRERP